MTHRHTSAQFIQIDFRIPYLSGFHGFLPGHIASLVGRCSRHHAGKSGLGPLRGLIMESSAGDAFNARFLLFSVVEFLVRREFSFHSERLLLGARLGLCREFPWAVTVIAVCS